MLFLLLCGTSLFAQNGRMDALGGNFCIEDLSSVLQSPASSAFYSDVFQGTAYQSGVFGPVIGIKSLGTMLAVGFFANYGGDTHSAFYNDATTFLDSTIDTTALPGAFLSYPHLFVSLRLPFGTLGGGVFRDNISHLTRSSEDGVEHSSKKEITHTGFDLNVSLVKGIFGVYPFMTYSLPAMSGEALSPVADSSVSAATTANRSLKYGIELNISPAEFVFTLGGVLFNEKYTFYGGNLQNSSNAINLTEAQTLYGGITAYPMDYLLLSVVYSFDHTRYKTITDDVVQSSPQYTNENWSELNHFIVGSCEIEYYVPIIDLTVFLRSGVSWHITTSNWESTYTEPDYAYSENITYPTTATQFVPTLGIGLKKGMVSFDIASKLAGWSGLAAGLPVVTGTLTLDFTSLKKK